MAENVNQNDILITITDSIKGIQAEIGKINIKLGEFKKYLDMHDEQISYLTKETQIIKKAVKPGPGKFEFVVSKITAQSIILIIIGVFLAGILFLSYFKGGVAEVQALMSSLGLFTTLLAVYFGLTLGNPAKWVNDLKHVVLKTLEKGREEVKPENGS